MKIVIVGGGASALFSAINIKNNDNEVLILEKDKELGKKILVTGNGRCNYFHDPLDIKSYYSSDIDILDKLITDDLKKEVLDKFNSLGIIPRIIDGYYYPYTNQAKTIRNMFLYEIDRLGISYLTNYEVKSIRSFNNGFIINNDITCDKLIISCGGDKYQYIDNNFNIKEEKIFPSLMPLVTDVNYDLKGIRCNASVSLFINGIFIDKEVGMLQFTQDGLSGICIFNLSREVPYALDNKANINIKVDFIPDIDDVDSFFNRYDIPLKEVLNRLLDQKIADMIVSKLDIGNKIYKELSNKEKSKLVKYLKEFSFNIIGYNEKLAEVTSGGVSLKEVDNNLESLKIKNLFFTGEVLDVVGKCGGYNLGFAWISSLIVSKKINSIR